LRLPGKLRTAPHHKRLPAGAPPPFLRSSNSGWSFRKEDDSHRTAVKCEGRVTAVRVFLAYFFVEAVMAAHPVISADKARGATINLRRPWQRAVFMTGLFGGAVLLALALVLEL
jgi:hypothetical protein